MWIQTTKGAFSIVQHRDEKTQVLVRARREQDILRFAGMVSNSDKMVGPWKDNMADYPWRIKISAEECSLVLCRLVLEINYDNFKSSVRDKQLLSAYYGVYESLLDIDERFPDNHESS